jgi:hypothetical protein
MAQPSLALENLQQTERISGTERGKAEEVIIGALGSMYLGSERALRWVLSRHDG